VTDYSEPRADVSKYTVYPRGYDQSPFSDSDHFCVCVERYPDTGRWRIHTSGSLICTHKGTWTWDRPQVRHLTRFDTAEAALKVALRAVDKRPGGRSLVNAIEGPRGREIAARKES